MRLIATDTGYLLESSSGASLNLTTEEALELAPIARQMQDHIRSRYPRTFPIHTFAVKDLVLSLDAHRAQLLLRLVGPDGLEVGYDVALEHASRLRDALTRKIKQIKAAQTERVQQ